MQCSQLFIRLWKEEEGQGLDGICTSVGFALLSSDRHLGARWPSAINSVFFFFFSAAAANLNHPSFGGRGAGLQMIRSNLEKQTLHGTQRKSSGLFALALTILRGFARLALNGVFLIG